MWRALVLLFVHRRLCAADGVELESEVDPGSVEEQRKVIAEAGKELEREALEADGDLDLAKRGVASLWEKHMKGYTPELMLTFDISMSRDEFFATEADDPVLIRGAWLSTGADGGKAAAVSINIVDPNEEKVFSAEAESGVFYFMSHAKGRYSFFISATKWVKSQRVTFTVGKGIDASLEEEHVQPVEDRVKSIKSSLDEIQTEGTYLWIKKKSGMKQLASISSRMYWFSAVQFFFLVVVSAFQVYYIKSLLTDNRRFTFY